MGKNSFCITTLIYYPSGKLHIVMRLQQLGIEYEGNSEKLQFGCISLDTKVIKKGDPIFPILDIIQKTDYIRENMNVCIQRT